MNALEAWAIYAYIVLVAGVAGFTGAAAFQLAWAIKWRRRNGAARAAAVQSGTVTLQGNDQLKFHDGMAVQMSASTGDDNGFVGLPYSCEACGTANGRHRRECRFCGAPR